MIKQWQMCPLPKILDAQLSYLSWQWLSWQLLFYGTFILNSGRRPGDVQVIVLCCHKKIVDMWKTGLESIRFLFSCLKSDFIQSESYQGLRVSVRGAALKWVFNSYPCMCTVSLISTCATVYWVFMCLNPRVTAFVCYTQTSTQKRTSLPLALMTTCFACESARLDKPSLWLFVMHVLFTDGGSSAQTHATV